MTTLKLDNKIFTVIIFLVLTVSCTYNGQDNDTGKSETKKFNSLIDSLNHKLYE
ncbi:MAG: hypothetical protein J0M08_10390 [Bacteroidetes bacterium]|nr:hypothetical protein [Bacteroidota bacterium]